jgi:hypothetical protein
VTVALTAPTTRSTAYPESCLLLNPRWSPRPDGRPPLPQDLSKLAAAATSLPVAELRGRVGGATAVGVEGPRRGRRASPIPVSSTAAGSASSFGFNPLLSKWPDCRSPADGDVRVVGNVAVEKDDSGKRGGGLRGAGRSVLQVVSMKAGRLSTPQCQISDTTADKSPGECCRVKRLSKVTASEQLGLMTVDTPA